MRTGHREDLKKKIRGQGHFKKVVECRGSGYYLAS